MDLPRPHILLSVLVQHFEELDYLWERRERCVFDSVWRLEPLAELEGRALRHLDGLAVGQGHCVDLVREALTGKDTGAATAAAFALLALGHEELREEVLEALASAESEVSHGVRIALRHRPLAGSEDFLRSLARSGSAVARTCAADVLAFHREAPVAEVRELLGHDDPALRALAISSIGRWRGPWESNDLVRELDGPSSGAARRAALETSVRSATTDLLATCHEIARRETDPIPEAVAFLGVIGGEAEVPLLERALGTAALSSRALEGFGALGIPAAVPPILEALRQPELAHSAAAAFVRITGAKGLKSDEPLPPPRGMSPDEADFWDERLEVHPTLAQGWWQENAGRFSKEGRWQQGHEVSAQPLAPGGVFPELTLESRRDVYLGQCWRAPASTPDLELELSAIAQLRGSS